LSSDDALEMSWSGYSDKLPQFAIEILKKIEAMKVDDA